MAVNEGFLQRLFQEILKIDIQLPLQRMPYKEAMARFGSDKPDLRFGYEIFPLEDVVKDCGFAVFDNAIQAPSGESRWTAALNSAAKKLTA